MQCLESWRPNWPLSKAGSSDTCGPHHLAALQCKSLGMKQQLFVAKISIKLIMHQLSVTNLEPQCSLNLNLCRSLECLEISLQKKDRLTKFCETASQKCETALQKVEQVQYAATKVTNSMLFQDLELNNVPFLIAYHIVVDCRTNYYFE